MKDEMKQDYQVYIEVVQTHEFVVPDANSPEEAESIAEQWLEDGDQGTVTDRDIYEIDSYPVPSEEEKAD
jgi:hypothetical protein